MSSFHLGSCVRGYHVSKDVWSALAGAVLQRERGKRNSKDPYVVAAQKDGLTVGHVPRTLSLPFALCLFGGGLIVCTITGASITRAGKSLVMTSTVLKVIFDRLLGHSPQRKCFFATHLPI